MGLTGDPALDDKAIRLIYSKGVAAKDQAMQQSKMLAMKETQWRDQQTNQYHTETLAINRSKEALNRERLDFEKTKAVKDPKIAAQKELNRIHNEYMGQYQRLIKERDKATTKDGKEVINERVAKLNNVYEQQKRDTSNSFGIPIVGTPAVKNVAQEAAASGF